MKELDIITIGGKVGTIVFVYSDNMCEVEFHEDGKWWVETITI